MNYREPCLQRKILLLLKKQFSYRCSKQAKWLQGAAAITHSQIYFYIMNITLIDRAIQLARQMQKQGYPVTSMGGDEQVFSIKFGFPISKDFCLWLQVGKGEELTITLIHLPTSEWLFRTSFLPKNLKLVLDCFVVPASKVYSPVKIAV